MNNVNPSVSNSGPPHILLIIFRRIFIFVQTLVELEVVLLTGFCNYAHACGLYPPGVMSVYDDTGSLIYVSTARAEVVSEFPEFLSDAYFIATIEAKSNLTKVLSRSIGDGGVSGIIVGSRCYDKDGYVYVSVRLRSDSARQPEGDHDMREREK